MPKIVDCPIKGFGGSVVFHDPLTYPILIKYEEAVDKARTAVTETDSLLKMRSALLPGILVCIAEWKLDSGKNYTVEDFPASPKKAAAEIIDWLMEQIGAIITGEDTDPNE